MPGPKICQAAAGNRISSVTRKASNGLTPTDHRTIQATRPTVSATSVAIRRGRLQGEGGGQVRDDLTDAFGAGLARGSDDAAPDDHAVGQLAHGTCLLARRDPEADGDRHIRGGTNA